MAVDPLFHRATAGICTFPADKRARNTQMGTNVNLLVLLPAFEVKNYFIITF